MQTAKKCWLGLPRNKRMISICNKSRLKQHQAGWSRSHGNTSSYVAWRYQHPMSYRAKETCGRCSDISGVEISHIKGHSPVIKLLSSFLLQAAGSILVYFLCMATSILSHVPTHCALSLSPILRSSSVNVIQSVTLFIWTHVTVH